MKSLLMFSGSAILLSIALLITVIAFCTYKNPNESAMVFNVSPFQESCNFE